MVSKTVVGIAAGIAGTLFLGYCIYFDRKRRTDPLFRQKLKERRDKQKKEQKTTVSSSSSTTSQLPNLKDPEQVQKYFLKQVQMGEELLAEGNFEMGTECLCNAVSVCGQPEHLLQILQQTLPPHVFDMLVHKLPATSQRMSVAMAASGGGGGASCTLVEEELE